MCIMHSSYEYSYCCIILTLSIPITSPVLKLFLKKHLIKSELKELLYPNKGGNVSVYSRTLLTYKNDLRTIFTVN